MSITDGMRSYVKQVEFLFTSLNGICERLLEICDRIDEAHEKALEEEYSRGVTDGIDADMEAEGLVRLPRDADDKPIDFGDKITVPWKPNEVYEVTGFSFTTKVAGAERTIWVMVYNPERRCNVSLCAANSCHHYCPPTVEDILVEYHKACQLHASELGWGTDEGKEKAWREIAEEFAAKLQLKEDE